MDSIMQFPLSFVCTSQKPMELANFASDAFASAVAVGFMTV